MLEPDMEALGCFSRVAKCDRKYECYLAKLLFVSGYKALEKLKQNPEEWRTEFHEYSEYIKEYRGASFDRQMEHFQSIYKQIKNSRDSTQQLDLINRALEALKDLPCYPSPCILEQDLHLLMTSLHIKNNKLSEAKHSIDKCKNMAEQLGLYSGSRESRISFKLVQVYEKENRI